MAAQLKIFIATSVVFHEIHDESKDMFIIFTFESIKAGLANIVFQPQDFVWVSMVMHVCVGARNQGPAEDQEPHHELRKRFFA